MIAGARINDFLRTAEDPAADDAIVAALEIVPPDAHAPLIELLISRNTEEGLKGVVELFDQLESSARAKIVGSTGRLFATLRASIRSSKNQTRLNALQIIRRSENPRLAYLAALAIYDGAVKIRAEAAVTLREMSLQHLSNHVQTTAILRDADDEEGTLARTIVATVRLIIEERQYLLSAMQDALANFESHHRPEVLEAAMLFADQLEEQLFTKNALSRGKLTQAMLDILGEHLPKKFVPFLYVALKYPELRRRIVDLLSTCRDPELFAEFIRQRWLASDPGIRKGLYQIRSLEWLGDGFEPSFTLPPDVAAAAPGWVLALGIPMEQKVSVLLNFLLIDNADANRAAAWALCQIDAPAATIGLQSALEHEDHEVRELAARELDFRQRRETTVRTPLGGNRPPEWSELIESAGLSEEFDDLWLNFERISPTRARAAGKRAIEFIPGLSVQIQNKLTCNMAIDRIRALRLIMALELAEHFKREIFAVTNDPTPEVRATAVRALGRIGDLTSRRILERALTQDAPTVQAQAVEALDQMGGITDPGIFIPLLDSVDAHVRAAAVRVLLKQREPKAAAVLVSMMQDPRVDHRCMALWVIDQYRLAAIAPRLREMVKSDPDPRITRTAQQVLRRLERALTDPDTDAAGVAKSEELP